VTPRATQHMDLASSCKQKENAVTSRRVNPKVRM
jgi:hypothetical protein